MVDRVDRSKRKAHRRGVSDAESGDNIRKRSPIEQAIAVQNDRRARWDDKKRKEGLKRSSFWTLETHSALVLELIKAINETGVDQSAFLRRAIGEVQQ